MIPFNKPSIVGNELNYIKTAIDSGWFAGDGIFTTKCNNWFESRYKITRAMMTTSCTAALEMSALLLDIHPGDEVIMPSYTFVSTANAFALRGARIVFADSMCDSPNINIDSIEPLITKKTKAVVPVHYAGIACDMKSIISLSSAYNLHIIEDAAQAIESLYVGKPLGSFGTFATFSFHETKNVISGEGGLIGINNEEYIKRAEIIRDKGTNRSAFFRGEVDKYSWVDIGSSYLPSELISAFLYAQLEKINEIQSKRLSLWDQYNSSLYELGQKEVISLPKVPEYATHNGHMFYIVCRNIQERESLQSFLRKNGVYAVFHYQSLHKSLFYRNKHDGRVLYNSDRFSDCLLRLPIFYDLTTKEIDKIIDLIFQWVNNLLSGKNTGDALI